jgi:Glycosyl hydrolase family 20, catalytic domain/beta-acetyl hexosaminidase like
MGRYNRWKIIFHILLVLLLPLKYVAVVGIKTNDHRRWNDSFVWPVPQIEIYERMRTYNNSVSLLRTFYADDWHFDFNVSKFNNDVNVNTIAWIDIMNAAQDRFQKFLNQSIPKDIDPSTFNKYFPVNPNNAELVTLQGVRFTIQNVSDTTLYFGMDESYEIRIHDPLRHVVGNTSKNWIEIWSTNVYGAMYGLETLKQLLQFGWKTVKENGSTAPNTSVFYLRNSTFNLYICDAPAYSVRGIMIDTARHYLPVDLIIGNLLVMASNKLNVLHWHMTDSQSFPYDSKQFPELATSGAFCYPECVYNTSQIQTIITQASLLGIRVIVEIDLPGHSQCKHFFPAAVK